ncbi:hypothetical protein D3C87_2016630 [compost metagenome]
MQPGRHAVIELLDTVVIVSIDQDPLFIVQIDTDTPELFPPMRAENVGRFLVGGVGGFVE